MASPSFDIKGVSGRGNFILSKWLTKCPVKARFKYGREVNMEPPKRIQPNNLADYLDVMSKSVFQSGTSWRVVDAKWPGTREAFRGFDQETISRFTRAELDRLAEDTCIIRNHCKIDAIVSNARRMLELESSPCGFRGYLRSHGSFDGAGQGPTQTVQVPG